MNQRKEYIDVAKGITIFWVVFTHGQMFLNTVSEEIQMITRWVGAFHMPLFFFVYGVVHNKEFLFKEGKQGVLSFLNKKIRRLLIPYLIWALFFGKLNLKSLPLILWGTNISLGHAESYPVLWFFPTMFWASILFQLYIEIFHLFNRYKHLFTVVIIISCYFIVEIFKNIEVPWRHFGGIDVAFTSVIFMISGMYLRIFIEKIKTNKQLLLVLTIVIFVITFYISKINADDSVGGYIFVYAIYGKSYLIYLINGVAMCLGVLLLSLLLENIKILSYVGKNSLAIMVLHCFVFEITVPIVLDIVKYNEVFVTLVNSILTIIICVPFIIFLKNYIPEAIGKK